MKKKTIGIFIFSLFLLLSGCSDTEPEWQREMGVGIFSDEENILLEWYPNSADILNKTENNDMDNGFLLYQSGKREVFTGFPELEEMNNMVYVENGEDNGPLAGIYVGSEIGSITKLYYDIQKSLDDDVPVLVFFIDGFSYEQYLEVRKTNQLQFLQNSLRDKVISVFTPVTNAGYAAMITGTTPDENGVHNRSYRDLKVESIFGYAKSNGKQGILLEGDIKILNTEIEPVLHVDLNKDGDTDDEMFDSARDALNGEFDLVFVHFHGVDDRGHKYGPLAAETLEYIAEVDSWISVLADSWEGNIFATADHGMHIAIQGGDHGQCRYEDMIVPYFSREKEYE